MLGGSNRPNTTRDSLPSAPTHVIRDGVTLVLATAVAWLRAQSVTI